MTALFLGAGASAAFGYPVTSQILNTILDRLEAGDLFSDHPEDDVAADGSEPDPLAWELTHGRPHIAAFPNVLDSRTAAEQMALLRDRLSILLPGLDRSRDQLPLITDVLSLVDHLLSSGEASSPRFLPRYLEELRELLERAILEVLRGPRDRALASAGQYRLDKLADWICGAKQDLGRPVAIISTNYDLLLETAIYRRLGGQAAVHRQIDYGFGWRDPSSGVVHDPPPDPVVRIYKLHGSLNWLRCMLCGHIYLNQFGTIIDQAFRKRLGWGNTCHCLQGPLRTVIVAPSMVRTIRDANLLGVWQKTLEGLRQAPRWAIIGYSLPGEDLAIRSILMRAERAHVGECQVEVYQRGRDLESRFRLLFPNCRYETGGMEKFIDDLVT